MIRRFSFRKNVSGQAMAEAAIVLPLFILILFIIIETALLMNAHSLLRTAVFGGCRQLAMDPGLSPVQLKLLVARELLPIVRRDEKSAGVLVPREARLALNPFPEIMVKSLWQDLECTAEFLDQGRQAKVTAVYSLPPLFPTNGLFARVLNLADSCAGEKTYFRLRYSAVLPVEEL